MGVEGAATLPLPRPTAPKLRRLWRPPLRINLVRRKATFGSRSLYEILLDFLEQWALKGVRYGVRRERRKMEVDGCRLFDLVDGEEASTCVEDALVVFLDHAYAQISHLIRYWHLYGFQSQGELLVELVEECIGGVLGAARVKARIMHFIEAIFL